jgi:hypothetical protein
VIVRVLVEVHPSVDPPALPLEGAQAASLSTFCFDPGAVRTPAQALSLAAHFMNAMEQAVAASQAGQAQGNGSAAPDPAKAAKIIVPSQLSAMRIKARG